VAEGDGLRLRKKAAPKAPAVPAQATAPLPPPPAPPKLLPLPVAVLAPFRAEAEEWIRAVMVEYGTDVVPEMGAKWCNRIMDSTSREQAAKLVSKAKTMAHLDLISLWSSHKIRGPLNSMTSEARAKDAEETAKMLDKKGKHEQAESQRLRAKEIRFEAKLLREGGQV
jgi:hypothetical protein